MEVSFSLFSFSGRLFFGGVGEFFWRGECNLLLAEEERLHTFFGGETLPTFLGGRRRYLFGRRIVYHYHFFGGGDFTILFRKES